MVMENKPKRMRTPWTIEDIRYLETHYGVKKTREIAAYLNRSATAVRAMAYLVGITAPVAMDWSETEIEIVRRDYPAGVALADICARLNGRAPKSVCWMARRLGLKRPGYWCAEEDEILRQYYPSEGVKVSRRLSGRTENAVKLRARELGVKFTGNGRLRLWTAEEWNVLSGNMALGPSALMKLLPGRSRCSVQRAMRRLRRMNAQKSVRQ